MSAARWMLIGKILVTVAAVGVTMMCWPPSKLIVLTCCLWFGIGLTWFA